MSAGFLWVSRHSQCLVSLPRRTRRATHLKQHVFMGGTLVEISRYSTFFLAFYANSFLCTFSSQGWSPQPEEYNGLPQKRPEGQSVFLGNHDDQGVTESRLDRIVSSQFVRLLPHDFQNGIYLRLEIMGCGDGQQIDKRMFCWLCENGHIFPERSS
ncbi:hypothetical protein XENOCAPTIV_010630 [Xenoophorus captivus]|uniref:F5/8 type C domain-containing protein n=1 Tax=Xenoophorus captivus TaxID=1517983 RepID=A0ABV0QAA4_9TELE